MDFDSTGTSWDIGNFEYTIYPEKDGSFTTMHNRIPPKQKMRHNLKQGERFSSKEEALEAILNFITVCDGIENDVFTMVRSYKSGELVSEKKIKGRHSF